MSPALRKLIPSNLGLRLLALGLALLAYGSVYLETEHEQILTIPLMLSNPSADRVPLDTPPGEAQVRVVAQGRLLARMRLAGIAEDELYALVRIPAGSDRVEIDLSPADVVVPLGLGLRVVEVISPTRVTLVLDDLVQRELPVVAALHGILPQGYVLSSKPALEPSSVQVGGPRTFVSAMEAVHTAAVDLAERREPFSEAVSLILDPRFECDPATVQLTVDIERTDQLRLENVPVVLRNLGRFAATHEPATGTVTILGPESRLKALKELHMAGEATGIAISLDAAGLGPGEHQVNPVVELGGQLRLISVDPTVFALRLARR